MSVSKHPRFLAGVIYADLTAVATGCAVIPILNWYAIAVAFAVFGVLSWATLLVIRCAHIISRRSEITDGPWS